jgi:formylglycine-generating enzyme required for sulfatase activity
MTAFTCPSCRKSFALDGHLAGKKVACPGCGRVTAVAAADASSSSPADASAPTRAASSGSAERWRVDALAAEHDPRLTAFLKQADRATRRASPRRLRLALRVGVLVLLTGMIGVAARAITAGASKRDGTGTDQSREGKTAGKRPLIGPEKGWPREIENGIGMKLVRIPPGTFTRGSPRGEEGREESDEEQHEVEITREFWLGVHEVTQKQFKAVMGYNPGFFSRVGEGKPGLTYLDWKKPAGGKDKAPADTSAFPVENVSWEEAREFCAKLSHREEEKKRGRAYRLPSEAEWEYACRGGAPAYQVFHLGASLSSRQANFNGHLPCGGAAEGIFLGRTCKVGSYQKNRFGLYDMHGNVWEWCADWYGADSYGSSPRSDPTGPSKGVGRVVRGGGWVSEGSRCRSANRHWITPGVRVDGVGFRVALVP